MSGNRIIPTYFDLTVIVAIAFRVQTYKAKIFRDFILRRLTEPTARPLFIQLSEYSKQSQVFN